MKFWLLRTCILIYTDIQGILYMCSRNTRIYVAMIRGLSPAGSMRLRWFIRCTDTVDCTWRPSVEVIASIYKIFKWDSLPTATYFFRHKQCCFCQPTHYLFWGNTRRILRNLFGCKLLCKSADIGHAWPVRHARPRRQWWGVVFFALGASCEQTSSLSASLHIWQSHWSVSRLWHSTSLGWKLKYSRSHTSSRVVDDSRRRLA